MTNPNHKLIDEFRAKYDKILTPVVRDLQKAGYTAKNVDNLINKLFNIHEVEPKTTDVILGLSIDGMIAGGSVIVNIPETKKWLLKNTWIEGNLNLSKTIHKNINLTKKNISHILKQNLGESVNWQKSAQDIYKLKDIKAELPKYIDDLVKQGKKALQDPALIADFYKQAKKAQKRINKLANLGYKDTRLKKAYQNIITQVNKGSIEGLNKGIERAVKAKSKYFAERIARSEIAQAHRNAVMLEAEENKKVIAFKWVLSARHPRPDICDVHARANLNGYGRGVHPKGKVPIYPHPQCMCDLVPMSKTQVGKIKRVNKNKALSRFKKKNPNLLNKKGQIPLYTTEVSKPKKVN
jgi:hypothetical protein